MNLTITNKSKLLVCESCILIVFLEDLYTNQKLPVLLCYLTKQAYRDCRSKHVYNKGET